MSESESEDSATAPNTPRIIESPVPSDTSMEPIFAIPVEDNLSENESDERNEGNLKEDKEQAGDVTESISCRNETKVTTESTKDTPTTERKTIETSEENQDIHEMNREKVDSTTTTNTDTATTTINPLTTTECEVSSTVSTDPSIKYNPHITYTEDGIAIYTDPKTHHKYKWDTSQNKWIYWMSDTGQSSGNTVDSTTTTTAAESNLYETEHYKWCPEKKEWMLKEASVQTETEHYKWDAEKKAWIPKVQAQHDAAVTYGIDADGQRIYTDKDGVVFFWDATKNAWFPKIDDDFMARYQMSYGFIDNTSAAEEANKLKEEEEEKRKAAELQRMTEEARAATEKAAKGEADDTTVKRKVTQQPPTWFELNPEQNTKVYVWNLPLDITLDEFAEIMSKCGMIMRDPQTQTYKLKLYTEADGQIKGDGLCDYIKVESVELALKILDEYEVRGHKIRVQRAKFQMRGEYNPALKPKRKKKDKEKLQKMKEKLFDWRPEKMRGERSKNEKVVIIKNLFTPEIFEKEVQLILDYQNDLREECSKCGTVRKVVIYDLHPEGVAQINMSCPEEADVVIKMMHGRYFGQRRLTAEHWDGKTKYKITETETAFKGRLNNWDKFLDTESDKKPATNSEITAETTAVATEQLTAEH